MGEAARNLETETEPGPSVVRRRHSPADIRAAIVARIGPIETEQESDGRWLADVPSMPGVMAYGATREAAIAAVQEIGLRLVRERTAAEFKAAFEAMPEDWKADLDRCHAESVRLGGTQGELRAWREGTHPLYPQK